MELVIALPARQVGTLVALPPAVRIVLRADTHLTEGTDRAMLAAEECTSPIEARVAVILVALVPMLEEALTAVRPVRLANTQARGQPFAHLVLLENTPLTDREAAHHVLRANITDIHPKAAVRAAQLAHIRRILEQLFVYHAEEATSLLPEPLPVQPVQPASMNTTVEGAILALLGSTRLPGLPLAVFVA